MFVTNGDKKTPKYLCNLCDFVTCNKKDYTRHLETIKHKNAYFVTDIQHNCDIMAKKTHLYICNYCDKEYKSRNGLWCHKKCCNVSSQLTPCNNPELSKEMFMMLLQQNHELQKQILEIVKEGKTINNNITTNNNQSFNMNIFLNEHCKDALNIGEFVNSLPLTLEDLENTGKVGYVKGITDIVVRGLKEMDVHKRPIHCSDLKREVMYVKDNDVWHKDEDNVKVKKAIQNIGTRNYRQVKEWIEKYPEAKDINTKKHEQYVQIRLKCTGGSDNAEDDRLQNKILSSIAKVVHINK